MQQYQVTVGPAVQTTGANLQGIRTQDSIGITVKEPDRRRARSSVQRERPPSAVRCESRAAVGRGGRRARQPALLLKMVSRNLPWYIDYIASW